MEVRTVGTYTLEIVNRNAAHTLVGGGSFMSSARGRTDPSDAGGPRGPSPPSVSCKLPARAARGA